MRKSTRLNQTKMSVTASVLVIEDDINLCETVQLYIEREGLRCLTAGSGKDGIAQIQRSRPDLVVLDLMLPDKDGFQVCQDLRSSQCFIPILMLTARAEEADRVQGLAIGLATELKISVAETIQQFAPKARVVEAFNSTFAEIIASDSRQFGADFPSVFYCGDDSEAKQIVAGLIADCGYEAIDAGNLLVARTLETLATAWVQFAVSSQLFPNLGLKALQR